MEVVLLVPKSRLSKRFSLFVAGHWVELLEQSQRVRQIRLLSLHVAGAVVIVVMTRNEGWTERKLLVQMGVVGECRHQRKQLTFPDLSGVFVQGSFGGLCRRGGRSLVA